ncbi:MAG TPA: LysM peptidoglycan-binding domain-containing protein [bacterium]
MFPIRSCVRAAAALAAVLVLSAAATARAGGVYFVKEGDTLARVGRIFGIGVDEIRAANPLVGDRIAPGDRLRIPDPVAPVAVAAGMPDQTVRHGVDQERVRQMVCREETVYHAVAKGETLTAIARRYHTSIGELRQINGLRSRSRLAVGQRLVVRRSGPRTHVVRRGETLTRVAALRHVPVADLRRLNGLEDDDLAAGQRLILEPCDRLAAAGSEPPPLGGPASDEEFREAVAAAAALASREAQGLVNAAPAAVPASDPAAAPPGIAQRVIGMAKTMLNIPYRFGGTTLRGIDCSAYVQMVFGLIDLQLPRTAREQFALGARVERAALAVGDLVFFRTYARFPSHVGIYLGDDLFIHASSVGRKVTIDSLDQGYYRKRFLGGRRVIDDDGPALAAAP